MRVFLILILIMLFYTACEKKEKKQVETIKPVDIKAAFFPTDSNTINSWIFAKSGPDTKSIRSHAWDLWAAINEKSGEHSDGSDLPIWETWLSRYEVYEPSSMETGKSRKAMRMLEQPRQFDHSAALKSGVQSFSDDIRLLSGVKYNNTAANHIKKNKYNEPSVLTAMYKKDSIENKKISQRKIIDFPNDAVVLKPTYWFIKRNDITVMPYWAGESKNATTYPKQPENDTWKKFIAVNTGKSEIATVSGKIKRWNGKMINDSTKEYIEIDYTADVISLEKFYYFTVSQEMIDANSNPEINFITNTTTGEKAVEAGDFAILVGMHISTKEIRKWTWQTVWWTPDYVNDPLANDQPAKVKGIWKNFAIKTAYYMVNPPENPKGKDLITFNPYLETDLGPKGKFSNCMSCHAAAVWPPAKSQYIFSGYTNQNNPSIFNNTLKLDFLWSIEVANQAKENN